jgi:hypothetical protein
MSRRSQLIFSLVGLAMSSIGLIVVLAVPGGTLHIAADAILMLALVVFALAYWRASRSRE